MIININKPDIIGLTTKIAKSTGVIDLIKSNKVFSKVAEIALNKYLGAPTLTSLSMRLNGTTFELPDCVCTVSQEKNIVQTALQGLDYTIKEFITKGDYNISVTATITDDVDDNYPLEKLADLMEFLESDQSIEIQSDFLELYSIRSVVVKTYKFDQQTHSNHQAFTMTLISDAPYEIKIKNDAEIK